MSSGGSFYIDAVQRSHIDHAVLYIPPCRTTLLWKDTEKQQAYRWDIEESDFNLKEFEFSDENYKEKLAGNVAWYPDISLESEQAGSHISFNAPTNRHFFQESTYLTKKVYSCGKEITPEPPYKVIGVMKKRVLLPDNKESTYLPYIAVYENKLTIGFYWLLTNQDSKEWIRKGEIKLPELPTYATDNLPDDFDVEYLVTNCVYFSQDSTKAVTYCALKKAKKVDFNRMAYLVFNVPIRIDITINSLGNIYYSFNEVASVSISNSQYKISLIIASEIASEFINNTRKPFIVSSNYDVLNFYSAIAEDKGESVEMVNCMWDWWGVSSWMLGMNMWYWGYTVRPVSMPSVPAVIRYYSNAKGFAGREIFSIPEINKIINSVCVPVAIIYPFGFGALNDISATLSVEYLGKSDTSIFDAQEITNFPQHLSINEIEARLSPLNMLSKDVSTHKIVSGSFLRFPRYVLFVRYYFDYGSAEKTFIESTYRLTAGQHINATNEVPNPPLVKPPHAAVETPASTPVYNFSGNYTSDATEEDTRIASFDVKGYSMKGGVSDSYLQNASQPYLKSNIAVLDIANNITVLAGYNKLILYKGNETKEFNFSYLAPKFIIPCFFSLDGSIQNGYRNSFVYEQVFPNPVSSQVNMAGIWSNISGIQYSSDKFGNFVLKYGNNNYLSNGQTFNGFNSLGVI